MGLALQLYHHTPSRILVQQLHHLGLCSSYNEVLLFLKNAAVTKETNLYGITEHFFVHYVIAEDTVPHLLSGKAISRAIRTHFLIDATLHILLLRNVFNNKDDDSDVSTSFTIQEQLELKEEIGDLLKQPTVIDEIEESVNVEKLNKIIASKLNSLKSCRTAKIWIQYMEMVAILKQFIRAERTGNFLLHLKTVSQMLPYLASTGHNNYTKSGRVYLQDMLSLKENNPKTYDSFTNGHHSIRVTDRYWAGLSPDYVIESQLMRCMKSNGGITHRRAITDSQRNTWVLSLPASTAINQLMQEITNVEQHSSDQHKENSASRIKRDKQDTDIVLKFLEQGSPFSGDCNTLRCIATDVTANNICNADDAQKVGQQIIDSMNGCSVENYVFKKNKQVILTSSKSPKTEESKHLEPSLLFQRILFLVDSKRQKIYKLELFKYELCNFPTALFEESEVMRSPDKPELGNAIAKSIDLDFTSIQFTSSRVTYVLDGGALLHKIHWKKNEIFDDILTSYLRYIKKHYEECIVVFDGYEGGASTKDMAHAKRNRVIGQEVFFTPEMKLTVKKEEFLSCKSNKVRFLQYLRKLLEENSVKVIQAPGDADLLIVQTAVKSSLHRGTVVIGADTDLLILLLHHFNPEGYSIYLFNEGKNTKPGKLWHINNIADKLGNDVCKRLLFSHAILGSDTTSRLYGIGKSLGLKLLVSQNQIYQKAADVFYQNHPNKTEIKKAGENAIVLLYGVEQEKDLDNVRYDIFQKKFVPTITLYIQKHFLLLLLLLNTTASVAIFQFKIG